jgi:hypothetical protein
MAGSRRLRISILAMMAAVALSAVFLGWIAAERRKRVAALNVELNRLEDRLNWAERMPSQGYVSKASLASDRMKCRACPVPARRNGSARGSGDPAAILADGAVGGASPFFMAQKHIFPRTSQALAVSR